MEQSLVWLVGVLGVPVINYLKDTFNLGGKKALLLTSAVSVILGIAVMFFSGEVVASDFNYGNLVAISGQVIAAATIAYNLLKK